jgi:hypothetical protein
MKIPEMLTKLLEIWMVEILMAKRLLWKDLKEEKLEGKEPDLNVLNIE